MTSNKAISRTQTLTLDNNELARIWAAAGHIGRQHKQGLLTLPTRAAVSPFMSSALELALASVSTPEEDMTAILDRTRGDLEAATLAMPSLSDALKTPPTPETARFLRLQLARNAATTTRVFSAETSKPASTEAASGDYEPYDTTPAAQLEEPDPSRRWLIEHLWQRAGTGIVGGSAKGAKTWLCLDLALSIASGTAALDRFDVHRPGGVLFISAEGGQSYLRERLNAICAHRGLNLGSLPHRLDIISTAIRIDTPDGLGRLRATIERSNPVLLVLDPLVRLHRIDENSASCVSALLSSLTELQRAYDLGIIVAHHASKHGARKGEMSGQGFRGSSDLYAWGDSNIFLGKKGNRFLLSAEHRAAPATEKWTMEATSDERPRLQIVDDAETQAESTSPMEDEKLQNQILEFLKTGPKSITEIRAAVKGSNARISAAINALVAKGKIVSVGRLWALAESYSAR